ncbi:hypothetical protein PVAG01_09355 [Phlyctema vagabunda]|uniref:P-loop containing nucleoside triphosphate hydrolase protein n=1 Tax=Phlyctema vagabunda TaxID=108571 RepID=A0ABR4P752_9HELO
MMQVLVLGMPRTGTQSLAEALMELGYGPIYHMREVGKNQHQGPWIAALQSKYEGKGEVFGREQFDSIFQGFSGVSDYPAAIFPEELIRAYPESKIILTTRDEELWEKSMLATLVHAHTAGSAPDAKPSAMRSLADLYHKHVWDNDIPKNGRRAFREHNELVAKVSPKERFLEYQVKDGWDPLCEFLEKDIPNIPFPRSDDWLSYKKEHAE